MINNILKKHKALGKDSPLNKADADMLDRIFKQAQLEREKAKDFEAKAQTHNQNTREILGINRTQTMSTPGTGLFLVSKVRDLLAVEHRGSEESMTEYGFDVVVGAAKSPKRRDAN